MAQIEMNALSVITCGSVTVRIFLPGMDKMALDDAGHTKKYRVLWLLHDEGESSVQWLASPAERIAEKYGIFIACPEQHHALCTNMKYGPRFEDYLVKELRGILKNNLPISVRPEDNYIGGVGTGGYGALKMAMKYPESFAKGFSLNGLTDMPAVADLALAGKDPGICHTKASLEAVFGDLAALRGSDNDLFALASAQTRPPLLLVCEENSPYFAENEALMRELRTGAELVRLPAGADFGSCQTSLPRAVEWMLA